MKNKKLNKNFPPNISAIQNQRSAAFMPTAANMPANFGGQMRGAAGGQRWSAGPAGAMGGAGGGGGALNASAAAFNQLQAAGYMMGAGGPNAAAAMGAAAQMGQYAAAQMGGPRGGQRGGMPFGAQMAARGGAQAARTQNRIPVATMPQAQPLGGQFRQPIQVEKDVYLKLGHFINSKRI